MRTCYIVAYDIADPKRLQRVHRTMRGYGDPLQYSVFRCVLSPSERVLLIEALTPLINHPGVWRILRMAQIEHKRISVYARSATYPRTPERISPCSSSLYSIPLNSYRFYVRCSYA